MTTKKILLGVAILLLLGAGCQLVSESLWPTKKTVQAELYLERDPNTAAGIESLSKAKDTKQAVIMKHVNTQLKAKHEMEKDEANYKVAIEQANINIGTAETEKAAMIGTVESPGWLTSLILGGSGFGLYFAGKVKKRPGDINPQEHQLMVKEEVNKAVAVAKIEAKNNGSGF